MNQKNRKQEVRKLLQLTPEEVIERAGDKLIVCNSIKELHHLFAAHIFNEIQTNNDNNNLTKIILPVGPTGQYPILTQLLLDKDVMLEQCWFFFMDEYCDNFAKSISSDHPLSFKKKVNELFLTQLIRNNNLNESNVIFPNENNINTIGKLIDYIGGIDTCYGGIGIHGHIAFNEPEPNVANTGPRLVNLNEYTITMNAIRTEVGGNLENFPSSAYTLGMKQILNVKRIRLYCRNDTDFDWANTILRIALFGKPGDDYPVTYIRDHPDYVIITDKDTLTSPEIIL